MRKVLPDCLSGACVLSSQIFCSVLDMLTVILRLRRVTEIQKVCICFLSCLGLGLISPFCFPLLPLQVLLSQLTILETMSSVSFLDFRDFLFPASGFQSVQFRLLENRLGLTRDRRLKVGACFLVFRLNSSCSSLLFFFPWQYSKSEYDSALSDRHKKEVRQAEESPSLLSLVDKWLSRTPFLQTKVSSPSFFFCLSSLR
jgi:hypothetical protein